MATLPAVLPPSPPSGGGKPQRFPFPSMIKICGSVAVIYRTEEGEIVVVLLSMEEGVRRRAVLCTERGTTKEEVYSLLKNIGRRDFVCFGCIDLGIKIIIVEFLPPQAWGEQE